MSQGDISPFLLKSQYNPVIHFDDKLDEVIADVASLKSAFNDLKDEFNGLKGAFSSLKGEFDVLKISIEHTIQKSLN